MIDGNVEDICMEREYMDIGKEGLAAVWIAFIVIGVVGILVAVLIILYIRRK